MIYGSPSGRWGADEAHPYDSNREVERDRHYQPHQVDPASFIPYTFATDEKYGRVRILPPTDESRRKGLVRVEAEINGVPVTLERLTWRLTKEATDAA